MILNKNSTEWKNVPRWVSLCMWGISKRRSVLLFEYACTIVATIAFFISFVFPEVTIAIALWGSAYWYAITIRWIDNANLWQKNT